LIGRYQDMQTINIRQEQGQLIAETKESIKRINEKEYFVNSQSSTHKNTAYYRLGKTIMQRRIHSYSKTYTLQQM
jgi:hypothetical protein